MTLAKFKKSIRLTLVIIFFVVYGLGFYLLGKNSSLVNDLKVMGEKNQIVPQSPIDSPEPYSDTQTSTITPSYVKLCANTVYSFQFSYPKDWFTTYNSEEQKCTYFAPYSFAVPYETSSFAIPVKVEVLNPADWQTTLSYWENPNDLHNVISSQDLQIDGRPIKKIELTSTGIGGKNRGFAETAYLIFDEKTPLAITYQQLDEKENTNDAKKVLDQIANSVKYF